MKHKEKDEVKTRHKRANEEGRRGQAKPDHQKHKGHKLGEHERVCGRIRQVDSLDDLLFVTVFHIESTKNKTTQAKPHSRKERNEVSRERRNEMPSEPRHSGAEEKGKK